MTLSSIVVHLDHSECCESRTRLAARLAKVHGSHLCGIVPTGVPEQWGMQPFNAATADATAAVSAPLLSTTCPDAEAALNQAGWRLYEEALLHVGGPVLILPGHGFPFGGAVARIACQRASSPPT